MRMGLGPYNQTSKLITVIGASNANECSALQTGQPRAKNGLAGKQGLRWAILIAGLAQHHEM